MSSGVKWSSGCSLPMIVGRGSRCFRAGLVLAVAPSRMAVGAGTMGGSSTTVSVRLRPNATSACRSCPAATLLRCRFAKTPAASRQLRASSSGMPARDARYETLRTSGSFLGSSIAARAAAKLPRGTKSCGCATAMSAKFREAMALSADTPASAASRKTVVFALDTQFPLQNRTGAISVTRSTTDKSFPS